MSTNINPNDPVIAMLKELVQQYETRLDAMEEAMMTLMEGTGKAIVLLQQRVLQLEAQHLAESPIPSEGGKEL